MTASVHIPGVRSTAGAEHAASSAPAGPSRRLESSGAAAKDTSAGQDSVAGQGSSFLAVMRQYSPAATAAEGRDSSAKGSSTKGSTKDKAADKSGSKEDKAQADVAVPVATSNPVREILPLQWAVPFQAHVAPDAETHGVAAGESDAPVEDKPEGQTSDSIALVADATKPQPSPVVSSKPDDLAFAAKLTQEPTPSVAPEVVREAKAHSPLQGQTGQKQAGSHYSDGGESAPQRKSSTLVAETAVKPSVFAPATQPAAAAYASTQTPAKVAAPDAGGSVATRMQEVVEARQVAAGPLHQITVRIPDVGEGATDVRFVERGGEIHVSVRTSDGETAQALRGGLNDFVGRLDNAGIRAEVWHPGADTSQSDSKQSQEQQNSQEQSMHQGGSGRQHSGSGSRQQQEQDNSKPEWVEWLESSLNSKGSSVSA